MGASLLWVSASLEPGFEVVGKGGAVFGMWERSQSSAVWSAEEAWRRGGARDDWVNTWRFCSSSSGRKPRERVGARREEAP